MCFYPRPLRERGSTDWLFTHAPSERSVGLQMARFSSSSSSTPPNLCSYPAEKNSSFVPTRPRKAQVFVSLRYRKRREVGRRVGLSLSMRSCSSSLSLPSHLQLFVPTRLKKAQVLFLPSREKLKFLFLLCIENAVGGAWVFGCVCHLVSSWVLYFFLDFPVKCFKQNLISK